MAFKLIGYQNPFLPICFYQFSCFKKYLLKQRINLDDFLVFETWYFKLQDSNCMSTL